MTDVTRALAEYDLGGFPGLALAGMDEAGRGPLCGPVYAACVMPDYENIPDGVNDSKRLSEKKRQRVRDAILGAARAVGVGSASAAEIDELNIVGATLLAMRRAYENMGEKPALLLVDGINDPQTDCPRRLIVRGDAASLAIAAASVVAKVARDAYMAALHEKYPQYGFIRHKGYGTAEHARALLEFGPIAEHRAKFIRNLLP